MRITLALGSGGPRGYAHIGVINELQARGHEIVAISGSSMGSVIGGLTAAGALAEFEDWARALTSRDVLRLMDVTFTGPGMIKADRVVGRVAEMLGDVLIEDLPIPFTAVATDLAARREVWFQRGPLDRAIRASIAIPGVITPAIIGGRVLVDGGVLNPVPLEPIASVPADRVVAVSLSGPPSTSEGTPPLVADAPAGALGEWIDRLRDGIVSRVPREGARPALRQDDGESAPADDLTFETGPGRVRMQDVLAQSLEAMEGMIERFRSAARPADIAIRVPADVCGRMDYHRAGEVIDAGRELAVEALDAAGL